MRPGIYAIAALFVCEASAHQPYESSAVARLEDGSLELVVTTSAEIAAKMVGASVSDAGALEGFRPQLLKAGAELYEVIADGTPLNPERVFFQSKNGEAVFSVIYSMARPAELRFRAAYLDKLSFEYSGSIAVLNIAGVFLGGQAKLKGGKTADTFVIHIPATASNPVSAPVNAVVTAAPAASASPSAQASPGSKKEARLLIIAGFCAILLLGAGVFWRFQKSRN